MDQTQSNTTNHEAVALVRRVTWAGLIANLVISIVKFVAGTLGHSQAVVADAVHSLSDSSTDIAVLIGVKYWSQPPDESHPYGHQRIETIVTAFIGLVLLLVGLGLGYNAIVSIPEPHQTAPDQIALIAAIVSIFAKEWLYRWTLHVGRKINSSALIANAWHHRSDALSSVPAALAVGIAILFPQMGYVDHVGAIIVSVFILYAAWGICKPALLELADFGASKKIRDEIRRIALTTEGVREIHKCRTRYLGGGVTVDMHVLIDGSLSLTRAHDIAMNASRRIKQQCPTVVDVLTHIEPYDSQRLKKS